MASLKRVTHKNGRVVYRIVISLGYDKDGRKRTRSLTYSVDQSASPRQQEREALKYAMGRIGIDAGELSIPLREPTPALCEEIDAEMKRLGLL